MFEDYDQIHVHVCTVIAAKLHVIYDSDPDLPCLHVHVLCVTQSIVKIISHLVYVTYGEGHMTGMRKYCQSGMHFKI